MKQRILYIRWLVAALMLSTLPAMAEVRDTLTFDISDLSSETIVGNNETFMRLSFPDCDHLDMVGAPMLPVKYIRLSVPYNATDVSVTATSTSSATIIPRRIYPAQMPLTTNDEPDTISFVMDSVIYSSNTYWPSNVAELVGDGFYLGENRIVTVAVYPLQYRPNNKMLRKNTQVRLVVQYSLGGTPTNMLVRRGGDLRLQEQESAKTIVRNPEQVHGFAMTEAQIQHMPPVGLLPDSLLTDTAGYGYGGELQQAWGDRARYLIVTTRELAPSFKRLAALKRQKGYSVQIKCIEDILADPRVQQGDIFRDSNGNIISTINDDAGKLRQYLKLARAFDNTQFVLLAGKDVPFRYGWHASIVANSYTTEVPTDLYYCDLSTNWNKNNNELYGEKSLYGNTTSYPEFDFEPELFIGRLMCKSDSDIQNYTKKLLCYELFPGHGNTDYLKRAFYFQHSDMKGEAATVHSKLKYLIPDSILIDEYRPMEYPKGKEIIDTLNRNPHGFVSLHTHGNPGHMTSSYNEYGSRVVKYCIQALDAQNVTEPNSWQYQEEIGNGLDNLSNAHSPFVLYTIACDVTPFDVYAEKSYNPPYQYHTDMNFGESFTLGKDYGGVAFLGNTRAGLVGSSAKLEKCFAEQLAINECAVGESEAKSKSCFYNTQYRLYINMIHNLIGDPEFKVWNNNLITIDDVLISRNESSISVNFFDPNGTFNIGLNDGVSQVLYTIENGSLTIPSINPNSTITLYRHNYYPYIAPLLIQNERIERSQYVIASDVKAGLSVDSNRLAGEVTIAAGSDFEIEAKGTVTLAPGFKVEKGALFSVTRSDY